MLIPLAEKTQKKLDTPEDLKAFKTGLGLPLQPGNLGLYREPGASKLTLILNHTLHIEIDVTKKEFIRCYNRVENAGNAKMDPELESLWNMTSRGGTGPMVGVGLKQVILLKSIKQ